MQTGGVIHLGTSGWQYDDWRGRFYAADEPKIRWLARYAERFDTVEVNNTFYRLPAADTFARWRDETPADFLFALKASRYLTHIRRLRGCADPLATFWARAQRLGEKLGPVLFQLPPRFPVERERLRVFVSELPDGMRAAFEFRDASWLDDDVYAILEGAGCAFVLADAPGVRVSETVTGGWSYVRFHRGRAEAPGYTTDKLRRWSRRIGTLAAQDVWVYFNNDTDACAPGGRKGAGRSARAQPTSSENVNSTPSASSSAMNASLSKATSAGCTPGSTFP